VLFAKYNYNDRVNEDEMGRVCSTNRVRRGIHIGYWWGKPERNGQLGRPRCRWVNNIKMDLREI
jgi:hypothetical protein